MENNKINPIGLKGNQINQRMIELMGIKPINESNTKSVVELTKIGPDGKTYGIVRENHDYYIKTSTKTSNLIVEDFNYIGGLQNKKSEAYPSYAKAIKHLNLNFKSLAEAYGKGGDINVFENDNLLTEDISGFSQYGGNGFTNEGNLEGNEALYTEEEEVEEVPENPEDYTKQPGYIHEEEEEEIELSEVEQAVENMLEADDVKNPGKYMDGEKEELGIDDDGDGVPNGADKDPKDGDIMESTFSIARAMENIDSVIDSLTETVLKKKSLETNISEDTKYKLKVAAPVAEPTAEPITEPADDAGSLDFGGGEEDSAPKDDKPFDDEPFDAGVEASEEEDPKKFIEQLTGKLGQSLRKYTETQGTPDFDLEKFAVNSLLSATHTSQMDSEDKNDIIKKVNTAGNDDSEGSNMDDANDNTDATNDVADGLGDGDDNGSENVGGEDLEEYEIFENLFLDKPVKNNMFQEGSNDILDEMKPCWKGYKQVGMKEKGGKEVPNCVPVNENYEGEEGSMNYMFWQNLKTIRHAAGEMLEMNQEQIDELCANGHAWAVDHVSSSADDIEEVYHFFEANMEDDSKDYDGETEGGYEDEYGSVEGSELYEGKYDGKPLGKPMKGDVKKFKVYVKNKKGNVVKVNFGDPNMEIKRDNPERRKSFRARHKCAQAKDRTTPKYWSCKMWSKTPVSKMVAENLVNPEKFSTFDKKYLINKLNETFNQEDMNNAEPKTAPVKTPIVKPGETKPVQPSRKNKPFLPMPEVQPDPKAMNESANKLPIYFNSFSEAVQAAAGYAEGKGFDINEDEWFNTVATGKRKPQEGDTNRYTITLYKDGKEQRKALHFQVYGMKNKYELNAYIS